MNLIDPQDQVSLTPSAKAKEDAFWERYHAVVLAAGVEEGVAVWYRPHVERFIRFITPRRLRAVHPADPWGFLLRIRREPDTKQWQATQVGRALRLLFQQLMRAP